MKTAKRKRVPTNENQEVDTLKQHTPATVDLLSSSKLSFYNQAIPPAPSSYYESMKNHRLSSLAMPPPLAPPPPPPQPSVSTSQPFDYINYYQHMYASATAAAVAAFPFIGNADRGPGVGCSQNAE